MDRPMPHSAGGVRAPCVVPVPAPRRRPARRWAALLVAAALAALLPGLVPGPGTATARAAAGPSGEPLVAADLPDFRLVQAEDFTQPVAIGQWPGPYAAGWHAYLDGWPDTAGQQGANSGYAPSKVVSVQGGALDYYLHTEGGRTLSAAVLPNRSHLYGRISFRMRADPLATHRIAFLYWPDSETWPRDGEIDYPEGEFTEAPAAFMHRMGATWAGDQDYYPTGVRLADWHTYTIEWTPGYLDFLLDGVRIGRSTERLPSTPMHFVFQSERCRFACADAPDAGHLQIDWVAIWDYAPGLQGSGTTPSGQQRPKRKFPTKLPVKQSAP
jgi:hypothetical protein